MKTILELIESWKPCAIYKYYIEGGYLNAGMTIDDILRSKDIRTADKEWFFNELLGSRFYVIVGPNKIRVRNDYHWKVHTYSYTTFLAIVDEYLEYANIDAAI